MGRGTVRVPLPIQWLRLHHKKATCSRKSLFCGGDGRDRTDDLLNAIQALSQLSYAPREPLFSTA